MSITDFQGYFDSWNALTGLQLTTFSNQCHDPASGRFCEGQGQHPDTTAALNPVFAAIDSTHSIPKGIKKVTIQAMPSNEQGQGVSGYYTTETTPQRKKVGDKFFTVQTKDRRIYLDPKSSHRELTAAHEYGHYLDEQAGLDTSPIREAIQRSFAYKQLQEQKGGELGKVDYLLSPKESFARAYAQYIATRSNSHQMKSQVQAAIDDFGSKHYSQWDDKDFTPIAEAFDKAFQDKGLLHQHATTAAATLTALSNDCHDSTGRFCEGTGTGTATQHPSPGADLGIMSSQDKKRFRDVLDVIASVHTLPNTLPNARVQLDPKLDRNTGGVYTEDTGLIRINPLDVDTMGQLNFIHEFGHHLTLADGGLIYPTDSHASKLGTKFLEKVGQSDLGNWYYQTVQSKAFNRQFQREGQNDDYASYLKNPKELFARSYTQWIVSHSKSPELKKQFDSWRTRGETSDIQWTDQDFAPISKALDEYFSAKHLTASAATLQEFGNTCHSPDTGQFCETEGTSATPHLDKQIKDLEDMINTYKDEEGSGPVVESLSKNLKALQAKKASGATPYHGADLYVDPRLLDYDREQEIKSIKETLDIISKIHEPDPSLQPVRISKDTSLTGGVLGNYRVAFNSIGVKDINDQFSLIHELGHWQTLNPNFDLRKSENPSSHFLENVKALGLQDVQTAITNSKAFKAVSARSDPYSAYLKTPDETYARAYAQYIAIRAGKPNLHRQMEQFRERTHSSDVQWNDMDFDPIAKAFDKYYAGTTASAASTEFANPCHSPDTGQFCETEGGAAASSTTTTTSARDLVRNIRVLENDHTYGGEEVAVALDAINSVHSLPANIDRVRIEIDHSGKLAAVGHEQSNGLYQPDIKTGDGTTKISLNAAADELELTAVHEFGHYIDHKGQLLWDSQWATSRTGDPPMQALQEAIRKSPQVGSLTRMSSDGTDEVKQAYAKYLLAPRELFARAYAQYIATRSGNETLKTQLSDILAGRSNHLQDGQWDEKSFEPIAAAMDSIFARKNLLAKASVTASALQFANPCHDAKGEFCETTGGQLVPRASDVEQALALKRAKAKIKNAPIPSPEKVLKERAAIARADAEGKRHGGEFRGNSTDRHRRQLALWKEFGGPEKGYLVDAATGVKMSWTKDPKENPTHLPVFTQGKAFTGYQGGSYTLDNLIPELLQSNQARGDTPVRKENLEAIVAAASITEFYNDCHDPSTGEFCGGNFPPESYIRPFPQVTEEFHQADRTFVSRLTAPEKEMIREYASVGDYKALNSGTNQIGARLLDEAIAKAPELSHPVRVYRGVMFNSAEKRQQALDELRTSLENQQPIKIGPEHGFQSTSVNTEYPMGIAGTSSNPGFMFEVMSKRGAPVGALGTPGEEELLIGRNEKFRVVSIQPQARFQTRLGVSRPIYTVQVEQL